MLALITLSFQCQCGDVSEATAYDPGRTKDKGDPRPLSHPSGPTHPESMPVDVFWEPNIACT